MDNSITRILTWGKCHRKKKVYIYIITRSSSANLIFPYRVTIRKYNDIKCAQNIVFTDYLPPHHCTNIKWEQGPENIHSSSKSRNFERGFQLDTKDSIATIFPQRNKFSQYHNS